MRSNAGTGASTRKWFLIAAVFGVMLRLAAGQDTASVHLVEQAPVAISKIAPGVFLVDFGRVAFGNLSLGPVNLATSQAVTVRFGEALKDGRVDTHPPGSVRYSEVKVRLDRAAAVIVAPPVNARNTTAPAVLTPASWGVLTPFRWVEVEGWPAELDRTRFAGVPPSIVHGSTMLRPSTPQTPCWIRSGTSATTRSRRRPLQESSWMGIASAWLMRRMLICLS